MSKRIAHKSFDESITSFLRHDDTASRVRTFADRSGRILDDTDLSYLPKVYNVKVYGAKGDQQTVSDASITSGTDDLTTVSDAFTAEDVGKAIRVYGAGAAGADLITTILAYVSATAVTLATNASTTIAAKQIKWGTDDTSAIQAAINAVNDSGKAGRVFFPYGWYTINGPLITSLNSVNPNCQIYIPLNTVALNRICFILEGEVKTAYNNGPLNNANLGVPTKGVILDSWIIGTGTAPCVLGSPFANNGFIDVNRNEVIIKNMAICVKSKTGVTHVASTMTRFDLYSMGVAHTDNILAFSESNVWESVQPAAGTFGVRLPQTASNENYGGTHGFIMAVGCDVGCRIAEHHVISKAVSVGCNKAFQVIGAGHPIVCVQLHSYACRYGIEFVNSPLINVLQFTSERYPGIFASKWYDGVADFLATTLTGAYGTVNYSITESGGAVPAPTFSGTFGGQINFHDLHADPYYIYTAGVSPSGLQAFSQLKYTGADVSTDVLIPDFLMIHKQTGTANIVGTWKVINDKSIAADKRLVQISGRTNGSVSKGMLRVSIHSGAALVAVTDFSTDSILLNVTLLLRAGAAAAGAAPMKFQNGTQLTAPESLVLEPATGGANLLFTPQGAAARYTLAKTLTNTAVLNFGSIASLANEILTITVTGAADGDAVSLGVPNGSMTAGLVFTAWVSAANTVSVQCYNSTLGAIDPASGTFRASVIKY
jgi:hypothetical protein